MIASYAPVLRVCVVIIACGAASFEAACRSAAEIDSPGLNVGDTPVLPPESLPQPGTVTASLPPGDGMDAVRSRCVACHDPAMLRQQRLTAQQWIGEIEKMQRWGAPVVDEEKIRMADYLVAIAGTDNTGFSPVIVAPLFP